MIVASFWTIGTPYEREAAALRETLDRFALAHDIRGLPHPGTWRAATLLFPSFIQAVRRDHPAEDVLFLDADARVLAPPVLLAELSGKYDAALFWLKNGPQAPVPGGDEICTGTTWWAPTPVADAILAPWAASCARPEVLALRGTDQEVLQRLLPAGPSSGVPEFPTRRLFALPPEYCWLDGISPERYGAREPVIYHTQASRRLRGVVGG